MSYIYDRFPTYRDALGFAWAAANATAFSPDGVRIFNTQDEAFNHDPFPCALEPPIVHVARDDGDTLEEYLRSLAEGVFHGRYSGT